MTDVTIFPIVGWDLKSSPAGYGVMTIKCHPGLPPAGTTQEKATQSLEFGIAAEQCELLAQDLIAMAARLREKRKSSN